MTNYIDKALTELSQRGLKGYSYIDAQQALYNGTISQDDYDLYSDTWHASPEKYSVMYCQRIAAINRLKVRYA